MKKCSWLKSITSLLGVALIGKMLSMLARLVMVNSIKSEAMGLFSLINPLMVLFINLAQIGLPIATGTLIAKRPKDGRKFFVSAFLIGFGISILLMITIFFFAPMFASVALKNSDTALAIYGLGLLIPLVTTSSILKGIYIGKGKVQMTTNSSIAEEIFRLVFLIFFIEKFSSISPAMGALGAVVGMALGEVGQCLYLFFIASRKTKRECISWLFKKEYDSTLAAMELLKISLPATAARLIGSLTYFFEPIIYTYLLSGIGIDSSTLLLEYGLLTGYVFPLLLLPAFFTTALSNFSLPTIAKSIEKNDYRQAAKSFKNLLLISSLLGLFMSTIIFLGADFLMKILYNQKEGADLVRLLAFFFLIYYIENPCIITLHALGRSKKALLSTIFSCIIRLGLLVALLKPLGIYAVAISTLGGAFIDISLNLIDITLVFKRNNIKTTLKVKA